MLKVWANTLHTSTFKVDVNPSTHGDAHVGFEKAYGRVKWSLMEGTMLHLDFHNQWISWVYLGYLLETTNSI